MSSEGALFCGAVNIWRIYSELKVQRHCLLVSRRAMYFENILIIGYGASGDELNCNLDVKNSIIIHCIGQRKNRLMQ